MRKASLGTLFLTVFLDLLGFGLVVPFLPGVARELGASALVATLLSAIYSLMQFLFVPLWGRISDRYGRRPVLLVSIAGSAVGMALLGLAGSVPLLFVARAFSGVATANIAVAQAYIADVTTPENRARGMGLIGMAFGLGFILGPALGGLLGKYALLGHPGAAAAFMAALLSAINLVLAGAFLPESLPAAARTGAGEGRRSPLDLRALRAVVSMRGVGLAVVLSFVVTFFFSGLEATYRLFTLDAFAMTVGATGAVFAFIGVIAAVVQGGLIGRLTRRYGEVRLIAAGSACLALGFLGVALSAWAGGVARTLFFVASGVVALGSGLNSPSLSSYTSRQADAGAQGLALGVLQSLSALARVLGPVVGGLFYEYGGPATPYLAGAVGFMICVPLALRLPRLAKATPLPVPAA